MSYYITMWYTVCVLLVMTSWHIWEKCHIIYLYILLYYIYRFLVWHLDQFSSIIFPTQSNRSFCPGTADQSWSLQIHFFV